MENNKRKGIEECFKELDEILGKLESEEVTLEESFSLYEKGISLVKAAEKNIDQVEKKLKILNGKEAEDEL